jgi:site-specific DNA-methyltransferase (adenine-specific)
MSASYARGLVLDPFCGSGSTGKAARLEGFDFIGIEKESVYVDIAKKRIDVRADTGVEGGGVSIGDLLGSVE